MTMNFIHIIIYIIMNINLFCCVNAIILNWLEKYCMSSDTLYRHVRLNRLLD